MEGDVFRTINPLKPQDGEQASEQVSEQGENSTRKIDFLTHHQKKVR